ncbi:MAG: hypothetical protein KC635_21525, partial [Myxococcales bacterium]|nr:hypothetical protein [Myxococcales bacterium]
MSFVLVLGGCPEDKPGNIGACAVDSECPSGICSSDGTCVDPEIDSDGDGLINRIEVQLGSSPSSPDTDGDGIDDGQEVQGTANVDTDGDGLADIIESATADADGDCITDQYDAENTTPNSDLSPMRDVVCPTVGLCADVDRSLFGVLCPAGEAVCDFTNVPGYADPEGTCDGVDENCDGAADEGFDDLDDDGVADCVDTDVDGDGVDDDEDNCPLVANANQEDAQADGIGDACASAFTLAFRAGPPTTVAVGAPFSAEVAVQDADGAVVTRFHGDVVVTLAAAAGEAPTLSGTRTLTAVDGVATFSDLAVASPGADLALHATSGDLAEAVGDAFTARSDQLGELRFTSAPEAVTAGGSFSATIGAFDPFDNVFATYDGSVRLVSSDPNATLPAEAFTFTAADAGAHRFDGLVLRASGEQTISVVDAEDDAVLATATIAVAPASASRFAILGMPEQAVAGVAPTLTIEALDAYGNVVTDFAGTATFASDDPQGAVPADYTFTTADAGVATTSAFIPRTAGARTLTVDDVGTHTMTATASTMVVHADAANLVVTVLTDPIVAGEPLSVEVRVVDAFGNLVTDYAGTVALSSTDSGATLPGSYTFTEADGGVHVFTGVVLVSSGQHSVGAAGSGVTGSTAISVGSGSDLVLDVVGVPATTTAGVAFNVTVTVKDAFGNVVTDYAGTLGLTSTDGAAVLPAALTLTAADAGQGMFMGVELRTAGAQSLTVADSAAGVSRTVSTTVKAAAAARMTLTGPASVTAGTPFSATVRVFDAFDNPATGYAGTLLFTSDDAAATLPGSTTFDSTTGVRTVTGFTLETAAAAAKVTVADSGDAGLTASLTLAVTPAAASRLALTQTPSTTTAGSSFSARVTVYDAYDNVATGYTGTIALTSGDAAAVLPGARAFVAGDAGTYQFTGIALKTAGSQTVRAADTSNATLSQQATVAVTAATATSLDVTAADETIAAGTPTSLV